VRYTLKGKRLLVTIWINAVLFIIKNQWLKNYMHLFHQLVKYVFF
jgi:hypothetical protein